MTAMIEYFSEPKTGLLIGLTVFRDTEVGRFKVLILPKGGKLWFSIGIRAKDNKVDLECLTYRFHFIYDKKLSEYTYVNGAGPVPIGKGATKQMLELVENFRKAESEFKENSPQKKAHAKK